jgi:predicted ATPase/DNA-binding winged helix-turn-helix (wHTH) protein
MTTEQQLPAKDEVSFGPFALRVAERRLEKQGNPVHLSARALDILAVLIERAGEVVSKKELMARVWSDVTVDEGSLRFHIVALRKALGDGQSGARYVTTAAGRGYCFVAPVSRSKVAEPAVAKDPVFERSHRLPARLTRMVGRDDAIRQILKQLAADRFVSIVGPGGIGKTTVAVAAAHQVLADFGGAVCHFDLGPLNDPRLVPVVVASTLGLHVQSNDPTPGLIGFLRDKRMLLIFDSCEHVIEAAAALAERIYQEAPRVHILVTSRESLRVEGEHVFQLSPLESPPDDARLSAAQVLAFPAAQLFVERVVASGHPFEPSESEAPMVGEICRRLDGIALAIELAAGRVNAYGIRETAALLDNRLRLQGRRTALLRHQTLGATLDWSYNLLPDRDSIVLRKLSVFVGVFTLEAARSVAVAHDVDDEEMVAAVASLVAKSLVAADTSGAATRYRLLDTTRAYALGKLIESGGANEAARRHAIHYLELLQRADVNLPAASDLQGFAVYGVHIANVRAALEWSLFQRGEIEIGTALAAAAAPLLLELSLLTECRRWTAQAIAALDDTTRDTRREMELQAALGLSLMFSESNSEEALIAIARGLELAEALADLPNQLQLLGRLHLFHYRTGDFRTALAVARRSEVVAREMADPAAIAAAHSLLGISHHLTEDLVTARMHLEAAIGHVPVSRRIDTLHFGLDYRNRAGICLARTLWLLGYPDQATTVARRTVEDAATLDHPVTLCIALIWAVSVFLWNGDWTSAEESIDRLIAHARNRSLVPYEAAGLGVKGYLSVMRGEAKTGIPLLQVSIEALHAHRYELMTTAFNSALAEGLLMTRQRHRALETIDQTIALVERNGDMFNLPELLRIKGNIVSSGPQPGLGRAETYFLRSLELAKTNYALAWQLRTATSLARLWSGQGRVEEARGVLVPIVARFTEGFESADYIAARQLLDGLGEPPVSI